MNILITHPSFPGQYFYLSRYLAMNPENRVVFLSKENGIGGNLEGVQLGIYQKPREVSAETHGYLRAAEEAVLEGQQVLKAIYSLKEKGFVPDVIIGHAGWGSLMYIQDFYPDVPVIGYFEWYYHSVKSDSYWWPDEVPDINAKLSIRTRNMHHLLSLDACDIGITPTQWQHDQFPQEYKSKIRIIHEGTDTAFCCPPEGDRPQMKIESVNLELPPGTEVITYVSRGFELIRGFDKFMEAIRIVLKHRPNCHVVIAGNDKIFYGAQLADNKTFKQIEEEKGGYDKDRVHFVGSLNRGDYRKMLQASWCHVYLTRPFILSWSMLECMSFGLPMVCSATPPVMEVMEDGVNGLLAEFRSPSHIAKRILELMEDRELAEKLGKAARQTVLDRFELNKCLKKMENVIYEAVRVKRVR